MQSPFMFTDTSHCRTKSFLKDFWECRADCPELSRYCPYTLRFGDTVFCKHPEGRSFEDAAHTRS